MKFKKFTTLIDEANKREIKNIILTYREFDTLCRNTRFSHCLLEKKKPIEYWIFGKRIIFDEDIEYQGLLTKSRIKI